jgi:hypothetical protein
MFDFEMKLENVIQKNLKIDVFVVRDRVKFLSNVKWRCEELWKQVRDQAERNYNKKKIQIEFKINDKIFLNAQNIIFIKSFKKLNYKYYESYMISALINKISYQFDFSFILKDIHDVFHVSFLKFVKDKNDETSSLIWIKNEKQWKIKKVVDKKNQKW